MKATFSSLLLVAAITAAPASFAHDHKDKHNPSNGDLPPGLQKKVDRGGDLPPGWQKKLHPGYHLDHDVYRHHRVVVPLDDNGLVTVEIGGKLIRLIQATREVVEVLDYYHPLTVIA